ncbi:MAG: hypothetical protein ACTSQ8_18780 [Candidatus Helarchaeota archaeon]
MMAILVDAPGTARICITSKLRGSPVIRAFGSSRMPEYSVLVTAIIDVFCYSISLTDPEKWAIIS